MSTIASSQIESQVPTVDFEIETVADLVHRLGDIPLERIRMHPAPGTAVEDDVASMQLCELIDGVVVEKALGFVESRLALFLGYLLETYLKTNPIGFVVGADGLTRVADGRLRIPDVSFITWERVGGKVPQVSIGPMAPDLAVEVLSQGNTKREMAEKRRDLFNAGTKLIWIMDPQKKTVSVYRNVDECRIIEADGRLDGEDVLPGFSLGTNEWIEAAMGERRG